MTINYLVLLYLVLTVICIFNGIRKGMVGIVFGIIGWIFILFFINISAPFIDDAIHSKTGVDEQINERIIERLETKYELSEKEEEGSGTDAVVSALPEKIRGEILDTINGSIEFVIKSVAGELTDSAVHGIAIIVALILGAIIIHLIYQILELIVKLPVLHGINKILGLFAGLFQSTFIMWTVMFVANCFSSSVLGSSIIDMSTSNALLLAVYRSNLIESILGL